jgi:hypothetical protein
MQQSPIPARLTGPAYAQVDVFVGDFPAAASRVYTELGKLHFGVLTVERGDTGIDRNALAHSCPPIRDTQMDLVDSFPLSFSDCF